MQYAIVQSVFDIQDRDKAGQEFIKKVETALNLGFKTNGPHTCTVFVTNGTAYIVLIQSLVTGEKQQ